MIVIRKKWLIIPALLAVITIGGMTLHADNLKGTVATDENLFLPLDRCSRETAMGDMAADAVHYASGADMAIICSGYIKSGIHQGTVSEDDIRAVFEPDERVCTLETDIISLKALLEECVRYIVVGADEKIDAEASGSFMFPQISGFSFKYDPTALPGERIYEISIAGNEVNISDTSKTYFLAAPEGMFDGSAGLLDTEYSPAKLTLTDSLRVYIDDGQARTYDRGRIYARGLSDNLITGSFPVRWVVLILGVIAICMILIIKRSVIFKKYTDEYGRPKKY